MSVDVETRTRPAPPSEEERLQPSLYPKPVAPPKGEESPLYYDIPMLKTPTWRWEIASYFFLGGLSAGAYILSKLADRLGGDRYRSLVRAGTAVAAAAFVPCPALLTKDLGDPSRFYHMLRILKPASPMNLGTWILSGYGGVLTLAAVREWLSRSDRSDRLSLLAASDAAGLPLALLMTSYTGVLLSTTSIPLWARNPWLGPLFSASAFYNGAEAVELWLAVEEEPVGPSEDDRSVEVLDQMKRLTRVAEAATLAGYLITSGRLSEPITRRRLSPLLWGGSVGLGIVVPTILEMVHNSSRRNRKWLRIAGAAAGLLGSFALRWAIVYGGRDSADDPRAARVTGA